MDQIARPSVTRPDYPDTSSALNTAECVFLMAVRWWVVDHRNGDDPKLRLCTAMRTAGAHDATFALDQFMTIIARTARQPIAIHGPRCPGLSPHEKQLLHAASLARNAETRPAKRALSDGLVSAAGAEFGAAALESLALLFAFSGLLFARRRLPIDARTSNESSTEANLTRSIH